MSKKKRLATENTENTENIKEVNAVGIFPKITSNCRIKQLTIKKGGQDIRLADFKVSSDQTAQLDSLIEAEEEVQVTISAIQGRLPGTS